MAEYTQDLAGNLEAIPLPELVQFLHASRRSGVLELQQPDGATARCTMIEGDLVDAEAGKLRDREALITMMHWRSGRFTLRSTKDTVIPKSGRISVPALVMEIARLEDELERHAADAPAPNAKLTLRNKAQAPVDELECGAVQVFEAIAQRPQIRVSELEAQLALAPIKVRLAVAWMMSKGMLGSRVSQTLAPVQVPATVNQWYLQILISHAAGMRALVISPPGTSIEDITALSHAIAEDLRATPSISAAVDGPSIVRIRPPAGGLLSLTFLPLKKKHRFLFQSFVRSAQLILLPEGSDSRETAEWQSDAPPSVALQRFASDGTPAALLNALKAYATLLMHKQAGFGA